MGLNHNSGWNTGSVIPEHPVRAGMVLRTADSEFRILDLTHDSCLIEAHPGAVLRGYVDIYDGRRHLETCLIVLAEPEGNCVRCSFKRRTLARDTAPVDFEQLVTGADLPGDLSQD